MKLVTRHFTFYDNETGWDIMGGWIQLPEPIANAKPFRVEVDPSAGTVRFVLDGGFGERVQLRTSDENEPEDRRKAGRS